MKKIALLFVTLFLSTCGMAVPALAKPPSACTSVAEIKAQARKDHLYFFELKAPERFVVEGISHLKRLDHVYLVDNGKKFMLLLVAKGCLVAYAPVTLDQLRAISLAARNFAI